MNVTRQEAIAIGNEIEDALAEIFAKRGLEKPSVRTSYGPYLKVTLQSSKMVEGENGVNTASLEAQAYASDCRWQADLDPEAVGKEFTLNFEQYIFIGVAPRSRKYPYLFKKVKDGKVYKFPGVYAQFLKKDAVAV